MKILFQGDSITDASGVKSNMHDLGKGYASFAAKLRFCFQTLSATISANQMTVSLQK